MRERLVGLRMVGMGTAILVLGAVCEAQAPPGPLPQSEAGGAVTGTPNPQPEKELERSKDLAGAWSWNAEQSDDPRKIRQQARGSGRGGGGRVSGGYPGGNVGWGGRGMHRGGGDEQREQMQQFLRPAGTLTFAQKEPEIDLSDDEGRKRTYFTDGRKLEKSKDPNSQQLAAKWDDYRLVTEEKGPNGDKIERSFEIAPGGQQLYETLHFTAGRNKAPIYIRYVYDRGLGPKSTTR